MKIRHRKSGELLEAVIELVEDEDWSKIKQQGNFGFKWAKEKNRIVHKIRLALEEEILGLISVEDVPRELRIHVRLIEVNRKDRGRDKRYEGIAGCLFAFTCKASFRKGYEGFVSLYPKTALVEYYKNQYGFRELGNQLYVELQSSEALIQKYLNGE